MTSIANDILRLGAAPLPTSGDDLASRLRTAIIELANGIHGADRLRITAALAGHDVTTLSVDASGVTVPVSDATPGRTPQPFAEARRDEGVIGDFVVEAHPIVVEGVPVDLAADAHGVRVAWVESADGQLAAQLIDPATDAPVTGSVRVAVTRAELIAGIERIAKTALADAGFDLRSLDVAIEQHGPRGARVRGEAKVRKGILGASARFGATATLDDAMVLRVADLELGSGNPIVGAIIASVRGRIEAVVAKPIDIAAQLPPGVRLADARLEVGDTIVGAARFA